MNNTEVKEEQVNFIWESICATCLSQDRKLYPPPDHFATCFQDLSLSEDDKLCWECHHTVLKMTAFRSRVQQAQAMFADLLSGKNRNVRSLSCLSLSKMAVDTFHIEEATDLKAEFCLELVKEEPLDTPSFDVDVKCEVDSDDEMGDETSEVNDEMGYEEMGDDDEDETLMEILKRKKPRNTTSIIMPTLYVLKGADTSETEDTSTNSNFSYSDTNKSIPVSNAPKEKEKEKVEVVNPNFTYSDVMTKDDILEWRKRKESLDVYTSSVYKCEKCIEPFENLNSYRNHEKRHTNLYGEVACEVCEMRTSDAAAMAHHMKSQHRLLKCNYCAHEWDNANAMRRHCSEAHAVPIAAWSCDQCGHEFGSWQKLSVHSRTHRVRSCPECGLLLRSSLERHMLRAHPDLPSRACWVCSAECKGDSGLKAHMEKHKKNSEAAYCAECDVHFSNKYVYRAHLRKTLRHAAPEDLKYRCEDCNIGFLDQYALTNHVDAVHDKQDKYPCEHCGEAFHTVVARKKHVRSAHEGRGPHKDKVCEHCGKAFTTKLLLAQHVNSHTGARPYKCTRCGAAFGFKSALYKHGRLVHKLKKKTG